MTICVIINEELSGKKTWKWFEKVHMGRERCSVINGYNSLAVVFKNHEQKKKKKLKEKQTIKTVQADINQLFAFSPNPLNWQFCDWIEQEAQISHRTRTV